MVGGIVGLDNQPTQQSNIGHEQLSSAPRDKYLGEILGEVLGAILSCILG